MKRKNKDLTIDMAVASVAAGLSICVAALNIIALLNFSKMSATEIVFSALILLSLDAAMYFAAWMAVDNIKEDLQDSHRYKRG